MAAILFRYKGSILASKNITAHPCNCPHKAECFLNGKCGKKAIIYKANISMVVVKQILNPVLTIIASLSRIHRKEIPLNNRKLFGKPLMLERIPVLNGASWSTVTPINSVPPGVTSALIQNYPLSRQTHH